MITSQSESLPVSGEGPNVLGLFVAQNVAVALGGEHAEVSGAWRIPAVLDELNFESALAKMKSNWALVGLVAGVAFDANGKCRQGFASISRGAASRFAAIGQLRVPSCAQENDDCGKLHPDN